MRDLIPPRTIRQAADELNVSVHTIRAWVISRRIAHVRLGRAIRVPYTENEIFEFRSENAVERVQSF